MPDLPRANDITRKRSAWDVFVTGGLEALTTALRRGQAFRDVEDLITLQRRFSAFSAALDERLAAAEILIDEGDEG